MLVHVLVAAYLNLYFNLSCHKMLKTVYYKISTLILHLQSLKKNWFIEPDFDLNWQK